MSSPKTPKTVTIKANTSSDAFEALKVSINKLADSGAEEEVKAKFVQFEQEHLWIATRWREARNFANKTMELIDRADPTIDGVITAFDSLQKLFDPRHGAYICVEAGYLNSKLSPLIAYSVEQFRAMWSHYWNPRVKMTIESKGKLMDAFYGHVCYLKHFFQSSLADQVDTDLLVDLLCAMLPYIVIYLASNENCEKGKFTHNIPLELGHMEFFVKTLTGDSKLDLTTVGVALLRLCKSFTAERRNLVIYDFALAEYKFIFSSYGYQYSEVEIVEFFDDTIDYLINSHFAGNNFADSFTKVNSETLFEEFWSLFNSPEIENSSVYLKRLSLVFKQFVKLYLSKGNQVEDLYSMSFLVDKLSGSTRFETLIRKVSSAQHRTSEAD